MPLNRSTILMMQMLRRLLVTIACLTGTPGVFGQEQHSSHQPAVPPAGAAASSGHGNEKNGRAPMPTMDHSGKHPPTDHEMSMAFGPIADTQDASGTAWQPAGT